MRPPTKEREMSQQSQLTTTSYQVTGMTCDHCVHAVSHEVGKVDGVHDVTVDLTAGTVTVTSERALDHAAVRDAVDEAGYQLA
jgi:copper chaperone